MSYGIIEPEAFTSMMALLKITSAEETEGKFEDTPLQTAFEVEVIDIGLTVEDALEMGLDPEPFSRKKDISWELLRSLSDVARDYLYRRSPYARGVSGARFELNAILPDTARIAYIERKLEENGIR